MLSKCRPELRICVTGRYIPPSFPDQLTLELLNTFSVPLILPKIQFAVSHIICRDLNTTGPREAYDEWCRRDGIRELNDPGSATHQVGNSIDQILPVPGLFVPPTSLLRLGSLDPSDHLGWGRNIFRLKF